MASFSRRAVSSGSSALASAAISGSPERASSSFPAICFSTPLSSAAAWMSASRDARSLATLVICFGCARTAGSDRASVSSR